MNLKTYTRDVLIVDVHVTHTIKGERKTTINEILCREDCPMQIPEIHAYIDMSRMEVNILSLLYDIRYG